jgi:septal ring factor EnvC (AmiA/AmiB activator)
MPLRPLHIALIATLAVGLGPVSLAQTTGGAQASSGQPDNHDRLDRLRRELVQLGRAQRAGESSAEGWRAKLLELNARQADLDRRMGANRDSLVHFLGALELYQRNPPPALLVNARSAKDAVRAAILMKAVLPELEVRRRAYLAEADELNKIRRSALVASAGLFSVESAEAERRARIERLAAAKSGLEASLDPEAAARARNAGAGASSMGDLLGRLADPAAPPPATPTGALRLESPVHGKLARKFGESGAKAGGDVRRSEGMVWRTETSATVLSPADATVDYAGPLKGQGVVLILKLNGDYRVVMTGLDRVTAAPGGKLAAGEPVGRMASNGAPELYLEMRHGSEPVNPARWLK